MKKLVAAGFCLAALAACRDSDTVSNPPVAQSGADSVVVAHFGNEVITAAEVDARILGLPASERPNAGADLDAWYRDQVRRMAVEHRLSAEAVAADLESDPVMVTSRAEAESELTVRLCLSELRPDTEEITPEDLHAAYEARAAQLALPERRSTFHIFLRNDPARPKESRLTDAANLRSRVLAGENFLRLARANSDSESRHRDGSLRWVVRGQLPAGFEEVIFGLEEGVPSEPVTTRDGVHLFYVDQILPAQQPAFDEARAKLGQTLAAERRQAALDEIEAAIEPQVDSVLLDRKAFSELVAGKDDEAVVLRVGSKVETLGGLRRRARSVLARRQDGASAKTVSEKTPGELIWPVLEQLRRRELIADHCRRQGWVPEHRLEQRLAAWQRGALVNSQRRHRLIEIAGHDEERLRLFYDSNVGRFSRPPAWHLRRLRVPMGDEASAVMARLEAATAGDGLTLESLQSGLGGEIDDLGFVGSADLHRLDPKLPPLVSGLSAGDLSPPYRSAETLDIVQLVERREAEPIPLDEIRDQVAAAYVDQHASEVYELLCDEIFAETELRFEPEGLAGLRRAGLPQPDVSVEQLESLLEEL